MNLNKVANDIYAHCINKNKNIKLTFLEFDVFVARDFLEKCNE